MNRRESIAAAFAGLAAVLWPWGGKGSTTSAMVTTYDPAEFEDTREVALLWWDNKTKTWYQLEGDLAVKQTWDVYPEDIMGWGNTCAQVRIK